MLSFIVNNNTIKFVDSTIGEVDLVSGSVNVYEATFNFDSTWSDYNKIAVFQRYSDRDGTTAVGSAYSMTLTKASLLTEDYTCTIPWEVLSTPGYLKIGVYGTKGSSTKNTCWVDPIFVDKGTSSAQPTAASADIYQDILDDYNEVIEQNEEIIEENAEIKEQNEEIQEAVGDIDDLEVEDFDNIVDALNYINGYLTTRKALTNPLRRDTSYYLGNITELDCTVPATKVYVPTCGPIYLDFDFLGSTAFTAHIRDTNSTIRSGSTLTNDYTFTVQPYKHYFITIFPVKGIESASDYWSIGIDFCEINPTYYSVTWNMQGHGTQIEQISVKGGSLVTEPTEPTAEGYVFGGWFTEAACTTEWDFEVDPVIQATILYAKWTAEEPVVTLTSAAPTEDEDSSADASGVQSDPVDSIS